MTKMHKNKLFASRFFHSPDFPENLPCSAAAKTRKLGRDVFSRPFRNGLRIVCFFVIITGEPALKRGSCHGFTPEPGRPGREKLMKRCTRMLDPTVYKDWQIAEDAEKSIPSVDAFREKMGLEPDEIIPYGRTPKLDFMKIMNRLRDKPDGKYIEVTAITPTPLGEGKSTTSLGLIEGLGKLGKNVGGCLRQPSGGPTMNVKGTAAGGRQRPADPHDGVFPGADGRHQRYHERPQPGHGGAERPDAA